MLDIEKLRKLKGLSILCIGSYPNIIQSILDYDFLSGKKTPSVVGIIASGRQNERYFFGKGEVMIPVFPSFESIPQKLREEVTAFFNNSSGRRVYSSTAKALDSLPGLLLGVIFAEETPEKHAIELFRKAREKEVTIIGPASVGLLLPGIGKIGAIGGVDGRQLTSAHVMTPGNVAVFSSSGGMSNELINLVTSSGHRISFALSFGGDRFPITTPLDALLAAQKDKQTDYIVYFGELGGYDEYEFADAIKSKKITKPVICYIAGSVSDMFATPPQFGHAKAMAGRSGEGALAKRKALKDVGALVADSFTEFVRIVRSLPKKEYKETEYAMIEKEMTDRQHALIATTVSGDRDGKVMVLGEELLPFAKGNSFAKIVGSLFLGKKLRSRDTENFIDFVLRLLVDHGPYVSGAVNTIITARAGKDMVSSLAAGLLTIGPRFGGAINDSAENWLQGATKGVSPAEFVENFAAKRQYIAGIGHKKYRIDVPDPRVKELLRYAVGKKHFTQFALSVEKITTAKKGNLILNVDGTIAAVLLDLLYEKEGYSVEELQKLVDSEFFNGLFVLSRSVGFISHFLDQKRLDEGLFRLPEEDVAQV
ncbi:MAG TPA: citrate/2-methylcitrate synthase [Candidatus Saccharimonadales bacterium]|nr:citrate/2-methylcitrate synthase [Candidatus Saccharimonadales bacterium]